MPTDIKLKNSVTATNAPTSLQQGEVAINITDKKVWVGNAATTPVLLLGSGADGTFTNLTVSGVASFADGTVSLPSITNIGDTNTGIFFPAADTIAFAEGGVESMRIDSSGNLGLGTSSPSYLLDAVKNQNASTFLSVSNSTSNTNAYAALRVTSDTNSYLYNFSAGYTTSGRFAAGTTLLDAGGINGLGLSTGGATPIVLYTNASERMRIDSSGLVSIGTTVGAAGLTVYKYGSTWTGAGANTYSVPAGNVYMQMGGVGSQNNWFGFTGVYGTSTGSANILLQANINNTSQQAGNYIGSEATGSTTADLTFGRMIAGATVGGNAAKSEAMRITSDGFVLIGTSTAASSASALTLYRNAADTEFFIQNSTTGTGSNGFRILATGNNVFLTNKEAGYIAVETSDTERMRITSDGDLLVGTTTVVSGTSTDRSGIVVKGTIGTRASMKVCANNDTATFALIIFANDTDGQIGSVTQNSNGTVNYNTNSDYRLKENITPMTGALEKVSQLKPCVGNWKKNGSYFQGFIAHELQEVIPDAVAGEKDAVETVDEVDADGNVIGTKEVPKYQGIDTSFLVATLTAAIQEQQALIENLTTRLNALEGK